MKKSMVITTVAMILVVVVAITTATFAWFTVSSNVGVTGDYTANSSDAALNLLNPTQVGISYTSTASTKAALETALTTVSNWGSSLTLGTASEMDPVVPVLASDVGASGAAGTGLEGTVNNSLFGFPQNITDDTAVRATLPEFVYGVYETMDTITGNSETFLNLTKGTGYAFAGESDEYTSAPKLFVATFYLANFTGESINADVQISIEAATAANADLNAARAARYILAYAPYSNSATTNFITNGYNYGVKYTDQGDVDVALVYGDANSVPNSTYNATISLDDTYATALLVKGGTPKQKGNVSTSLTTEGSEFSSSNTVKTDVAAMTIASTNLSPSVTQDGENPTISLNNVMVVSLVLWLDGWQIGTDGSSGHFSFNLDIARPDSTN